MILFVDGNTQSKDIAANVSGGFHPNHQRWYHEHTIRLGQGAHRLRLERSGAVPHLDAFALIPSTLLPPDLQRTPILRIALGLKESTIPDPLELLATASQLSCDLSAIPAPKNEVLASLLVGSTPADLDELGVRHSILFDLVLKRTLHLETASGDPKKKPPKELEGDWESLRKGLFLEGGLFFLTPEEASAIVDKALQSQQRAQLALAEEHAKSKPPTPPMAIAVRDGKPTDLAIHIRGSHLTLGEEPVPRGIPQFLTYKREPATIPANESGRLQLAKALTDPRNPLTARVIVNRIWALHFGQGLCRSLSNLGLRGDQPSHPELLDWLADEFMAQGWSLKWLHRTIMSSRTWRLSSIPNAESQAKDPDNRLLHRVLRRRLDAEGLRDAILATSGSLDLQMGGTLLTAKNFDYVTNDQSGNAAKYDSYRRAIYLPIIRNALYSMFTIFDYNDPSTPLEQRPSTVIGSQALFFLNSEFLLGQSRRLALDVSSDCEDQTLQVKHLWNRIFRRDPSHEELELSLGFLKTVPTERKSDDSLHLPLIALTQTLFASSEFLFID
jgi:hypothetical protein